MRKWIICLLSSSFILLILLFFYVNSLNNINIGNASEAFMALETNDLNEEIYFFSSVPKDEVSKIERLWGNILTYFDLRSNNPIVSFDKDGKEKEERQSDNGKIYVGFNRIEHENHYSLYVDINTSDNTMDIQKSIAVLEKIFNEISLKYEVTVGIKGSKLGRLNKEDVFNIKNTLLEKCNAVLISEYEDDNLYSLTGFSNGLGRFIRIAGKKVNLNIAFRYSESENKTYIYLATPVIRTEV